MSAPYPPENQYRDQPSGMQDAQIHDVHDVTDVHDLALDDVTMGDGNNIHATSAYAEHYQQKRRRWVGKPMLWATAGCLVLVAILITIIAVIGGKSDGDEGPKVGTDLPGPDVPQSQHEKNRNHLAQILLTRYSERGMDMTPVSNPESFQGRALDYVAGSELYTSLTPDENVERYALVTFYLFTYRQPHMLNAVADTWIRNDKWLTNTDVCLWEGIECNSDEMVVGIVLNENRLSGILPMELSLLENLGKLDLTSNLIYMDSDYHGVWALLPSLKELLMDDNYVISETGIPVEFSGMASIEKISLSFNLLQGTFDQQVFGSMSTLVHFEAESNYIGGDLPANFLSLPDLTYVYLRRNSFEFPLSDVFQPGNLPSLFALWLDGNIISGTIPAAIGGFTGIASLSITDAQLEGPIPVEMAQLTDLQRLWLYDNKLSGEIPPEAAAAWTNIEVFEVYGNDLVGTMPQPICTAIANSDYELASVSADCGEVFCENCCTECY